MGDLGGSVSALSGRLDSTILSAEASVGAVGAHFSSCSSTGSSRYTAAGGISALQASLQATYGDDDNNLRLGAGTAIGVGGGFDYQRRLNENGTTTRSLDVGLAAAGRFTLGVTFTTLTAEEHAERERNYNPVISP